MHIMDTQVDADPFSCFNDLLLNLFFGFGYNLFNACRVNTSVGNQFMKGKTCNFPPDRIKSG